MFQDLRLIDRLDRIGLGIPLLDRLVDLLVVELRTFAKLPLPNSFSMLYR